MLLITMALNRFHINRIHLSLPNVIMNEMDQTIIVSHEEGINFFLRVHKTATLFLIDPRLFLNGLNHNHYIPF